MCNLVEKVTAYENHEGTPHTFEVFIQNINGTAPFMIMLDGSFLATAENGLEVSEEIKSNIEWFGWNTVNPTFA